MPTLLTVSAIGAIAILPFWRHAGGELTSPVALFVFLELVIGPIVIARLFSALAIWTYIGAWVCTLGDALRDRLARHAIAARRAGPQRRD